MKPTELIKATLLPVIEVSVLLPLLMFWVFVSIGTSGSPLGFLVLILCLPALFRYQSLLLESSAKGETPGAFDAEFFNWIGTMWTLFPLPLALAFVMGAYYAGGAWGDAGVWTVIGVAASILPASLALLAISHSPLEAINPFAIKRLYSKAASTFWIAPAYFLAAFFISNQADELPTLVGNLVDLFLFFSFATLIGALIRPFDLISDVHIPDAVKRDEQTIAGDIETARTLALSHAYGFISRDNRTGGFNHIMAEIKKDSDPAGAWAWYFDRMLAWENKQHAMFFAQHHVADMLDHGEDIPALKAIIRCRLVDEGFKPFPEDVPRATSAAQRSGNIELAAVLKRG